MPALMRRRPTARRQRNPGVVYTGRVGAKMRPLVHRISRPAARKSPYRLLDGPWKGHRIWLAAEGDGCTLPIIINGVAGAYRGCRWHPGA